MKSYLVGGAVRDKLLDYPVKEKDWVVVGATAAEMETLGYRLVGKDFPVFLHPQTHEEYALARTERKSAHGYKGFTVLASPDVTLEEDLLRRDLTINAMALDENNQLIDPFNGHSDLENRIFRHVSDAFAEDPLRVLRVARFMARYAHLGFTIAAETMTLMRDIVAQGEIEHLVPERIWQETERALGEASPNRFFEVLRECGALAIIFPEVDRLFGVPQPENYHPEIDTGVHVMMCLQAAVRLNADTETRFAVLTHDLGKGTTPQDILPSHIGHEERGVDLLKALDKRIRLPKSFKQLALVVAQYHTHVHRAEEIKPSTTLKTLQAMDAFRKPERFEKILTACIADARGRTGYENCDYPQADIFRRALQAANSVDVQALVQQGYKGEELAGRIAEARIRAISAA